MKTKSPLKCPHCGKPIPNHLVLSHAAGIASGQRKTYGAGTGRPKKLTACEGCGEKLGVTEMRAHKCGK